MSRFTTGALRLLRRGVVFVVLASTALADDHCPPERGVALQVLGSGGPIAENGRAGTGYLVWIDGTARIMIDAGAGTFLRFAESGAQVGDLEFIGISHFHTDHSVDFPALLKSGSFRQRETSIAVAGPGGSDLFPGLNAWLRSLLDRDEGAYGYLSAYLDGDGRLQKLDTVEVSGRDAERVFDSNDESIRIDAMAVPHGIVPALAFRVQAGDHSLVFASDQNGSNEQFVEFASEADLLIMHLVVPENAGPTARRLHASPSIIGRIANAARAERLMLSHFMSRSLRNLDDNVAAVGDGYSGEVVLAQDLLCVAFDNTM